MVFKRKSKDKKRTERKPGLIVSERPKSIIAEQFLTLRTNIQFSAIDQNLKTICITSATVDAGKSLVAVNLATAFASEDCRVLLVDADLRKPTVHATYRLSNSQGLTTLLQNLRADLANLIYKTATEGLYLLTSGPVPPNPADLLGSNRMSQRIEEMQESFDLVVFDLPPLLPVTDAQVMAGKTDGVVFIVEMNKSAKEDLIKAKEILEIADANVLGAVMNRVEKTNGSYYYYGEEE